MSLRGRDSPGVVVNLWNVAVIGDGGLVVLTRPSSGAHSNE